MVQVSDVHFFLIIIKKKIIIIIIINLLLLKIDYRVRAVWYMLQGCSTVDSSFYRLIRYSVGVYNYRHLALLHNFGSI